MFYHERLKPIDWTGQTVYWRQTKYNGHRCTMFVQADLRILAFEREPLLVLDLSEYLKQQDWWRALRALPARSSIDGELWVPDEPNSYVTTAIRSADKRLRFTPFAVPVIAGNDQRYAPMLDIAAFVESMGLTFAETTQYHNETLEELVAQAKANEVEGFVLKQAHYHGWYKVKPTKTVDCFVVSLKPGAGKYTGQVGALRVAVYRDDRQVVIASVSGMSDEERAGINTRSIGRVCEVEYQNVGAGGRLIHPRFLRWREDKTRFACLWSQLV